ncbi:DNA-binding transcriptional LysR family regulator [Leucobacter exalbidus]|uniref:DNA-binding transcriptional LysR family regulator n=1 Tax=Leucobacter exalbidus TaxID=662960 RepID=A0A940PW55_9MICO|nr:LysR family transcriptional regulator [Leucobacter exalbidus]MBP1326256.1 DNA-binding transcriptional LysR family regulator [Leucobacter exalbidus]
MAQRFSITLTQLSYFTECAKTLNMTAASAELRVAQSAVSTAISHLERALGTALFIRQHSKGLILTQAGESLLRDTGRIFGMLTDAIEDIRADHDQVRGVITIACFNTLAPFMQPQLLALMQQRHPELTVNIIEGDYEECLAALRGGRAEVAVMYNLTSAEGISHQVLGKVRPHVILHAEHPLAQRTEISLTELADDPFVLLDLPDSNDYFLGMLRQQGLTPNIKYRTSSYETVRSLVATGLGFSILNQRPQIAETYSGNRTVIVEISDPVPSLGVTASTLTQVDRSARTHAVAEAVREIIAPQELAEPPVM